MIRIDQPHSAVSRPRDGQFSEELYRLVRAVWDDRWSGDARLAVAEYLALKRLATGVPDPIPPLPGGDLFAAHWRHLYAPFYASKSEAGAIRIIRGQRGGLSYLPRDAHLRPFRRAGRLDVAGIPCLVGDTEHDLGEAFRVSENLQYMFCLPVTFALAPVGAVGTSVRYLVWTAPAGHGPGYWPWTDPPRPRPRNRAVRPDLVTA